MARVISVSYWLNHDITVWYVFWYVPFLLTDRMMSLSFKPALSAGDPGVMSTTTGSLYPQFLFSLISKANPKLQVTASFWAITLPTKIKMNRQTFNIRFIALHFCRLQRYIFFINYGGYLSSRGGGKGNVFRERDFVSRRLGKIVRLTLSLSK